MTKTRATVLIVDDDPAIRHGLALRLRHAGYTSTAVSTGAQAIAACAAERPNVVILDVTLPDTSGYLVCEQIRGQGHHPEPAVVFLTGTPHIGMDTSTRDRLIDAVGGHYFLKKPYDPERLIALVDSITGQTRHHLPAVSALMAFTPIAAWPAQQRHPSGDGCRTAKPPQES